MELVGTTRPHWAQGWVSAFIPPSYAGRFVVFLDQEQVRGRPLGQTCSLNVFSEGPRANQKRETREAILEPARAEFESEGFDGANMRAIAKRASVAPRQLEPPTSSKDCCPPTTDGCCFLRAASVSAAAE